MNSERSRLQSFAAWPANAPVEPQQLARCGFFATGTFLEVECNWCHRRISNWEYGDQVSERHEIADSLCPFLINNENCGNVRNTLETLGDAATCSNSELFVEANRLATFKYWPNPNISPQSLAKAGFFYLNRSDEVKCAWCKGVIAKWEKEDNAFEEHKRFFPDCPRVQLGPLIEMASNGIRDLGIQQITPPKKPKFSSLDARLRTYTRWPISNIQQPEALAQAGLYYLDTDDHVRCFHCNIGMRSWQKEDDPWFEHAKWSSQCQFVRLVKGANYVEHVQGLSKTNEANNTDRPNGAVITIQDALTSEPIRLALNMGIDAGALRSTTQRQIARTGHAYDTVEELIRAVFDERTDEHADDEERTSGDADSDGSNSIFRLSSYLPVLPQTDDAASTSVNPTAPPYEEPSCLSHQVETFNPPDVVLQTTTATSTATLAKSEPESATTSVPVLKQTLSLEEENRKLRDARLCKVCLDDEVGVVFLPCGHLVTCVQCAPGVSQCPMCRTDIKGFVRTFLS